MKNNYIKPSRDDRDIDRRKYNFVKTFWRPITLNGKRRVSWLQQDMINYYLYLTRRYMIPDTD